MSRYDGVKVTKKINSARIEKQINNIQNNPLLDDDEKFEKIEKLTNLPATINSKVCKEKLAHKKFVYEFLKAGCPANFRYDIDDKSIDALEIILKQVSQMILFKPELIGSLIESAYGIRVEDQSDFFKTVKQITTKYSRESSEKLVHDLNEVIHSYMDRLKSLVSSSDPLTWKMDIAAGSQILKNIEGYLKILMPVSKIKEVNSDADEELKRTKIKSMQGDNDKPQRIQNQYNIIQISQEDKDKARQTIVEQMNDVSHFNK